jgi:hypothetical protein
MTEVNLKGIENFKERLIKELDNLTIKKQEKECIIQLIEMELNYPTNDKDAYDRYEKIIDRVREN